MLVKVSVRSGACLSMSDVSPSLKALTKQSTSPGVVCNMEETTMSCLKASRSMARSFLKETVFCMGTGLARVVVTCKFPKVATKSGVGDGDVGYDVTGFTPIHSLPVIPAWGSGKERAKRIPSYS